MYKLIRVVDRSTTKNVTMMKSLTSSYALLVQLKKQSHTVIGKFTWSPVMIMLLIAFNFWNQKHSNFSADTEKESQFYHYFYMLSQTHFPPTMFCTDSRNYINPNNPLFCTPSSTVLLILGLHFAFVTITSPSMYVDTYRKKVPRLKICKLQTNWAAYF